MADASWRGLRLIVCGGRDYADRDTAWAVLDRVHAERGIREIIEGGQRGADTLAGEWADARGVKRTTIAADWTLGPKAGPLRNAAMVALKPDGLIALPGGRGTADMVRQAHRAGVIVWTPMRSDIAS